MKILILSEFFPSKKGLKFSGGVEARNYFVAKNLGKKHKIYVISSNIIGEKVGRQKYSNINVIRVGKKQQYIATAGSVTQRIFFIINSIKAADNLDIDLVEGTNYLTHFAAKIISIRKKIPVIAWYPDVWLGSWVQNVGLFGLIGETLERINLLFGFNIYIAISKSTADKLRKHTSKKIFIIPCGIDSMEFNHRRNSMKTTSIVCVSRLTKYKKIKNLILAFALVVRKKKDAQLLIVGRGPELNHIKNLLKQLKIVKSVKLTSNLKRTELLSIYKSGYIFTLPSEVEGFGISVLEAAAAGLPYVINDIQAFREITLNGKGGIITNTGQLNNYAQKILDLLNDKNLYKKKQAELAQITKIYSWKKVTTATENVYKSLV